MRAHPMPGPPRWARQRLATVIIAVIVGLSTILAITVVTLGRSRCSNVSFHAVESGETTPPVGGQAPVLDRIRRAFRLAHSNVVYCHDFADPTVLRVGNSYYAYSTNSGDRHIPVLYGGGLFDAQHITDALPR